MKMKYEREQGMTSIYRKLKKKCRSSNVRRHLSTLILAVVMMAPAGVYADWAGCILSEKPAEQAFDAQWADENGDISLLSADPADQIVFEGHGVVHLVLTEAGQEPDAGTVHGAIRLTVGPVGDNEVILEDLHCTLPSCDGEFNTGALPPGTKINVDLKGAYEVTINGTVTGSQRGTLNFVLKVDGVPEMCL